MSDDDMNLLAGDLEIEARIVAAVLGEASAFELAELERITSEKPELSIFQRRIEAVHGLVVAAVKGEGKPLRLSDERRRNLLEVLEQQADPPKTIMMPVENPRRRWLVRVIGYAAALLVMAILAGISLPVFSSVQTRGGNAKKLTFAAGPPSVPSGDVIAKSGVAERGYSGSNELADQKLAAAREDHAYSGIAGTSGNTSSLSSPDAPVVSWLKGDVGNLQANSRPKNSPTFGSFQAPQSNLSADYRKGSLASRTEEEGVSAHRERDLRPYDPDPPLTLATAPSTDEPSVAAAAREQAQILGKDHGMKTESASGFINYGSQIEAEGGVPSLGALPVLGQGKSTDAITLSEPTDVLITKEYQVPAEMVSALTGATGAEEAAPTSQSPSMPNPPITAKDFLARQGVVFPSGSTALYIPQTHRLLVRNTQESLDLIDTLREPVPAGGGQEESSKARASSQKTGVDLLSSRYVTTRSGAGGGIPVLGSLKRSPVAQNLPALSQDENKASDEPFSTFSLHVSDVSFLLAQTSLAGGRMPDPESIRPEEFYNAFDYGDPSPAGGEKISCRIEQCAHPLLQQRNLVRIAMKVAASGRGLNQPLRLTVLLDTSGSMLREDRAASVRRALEVLASLLAAKDTVTLIGFARQPRLLAEQVPGSDARKLAAIAAHTPSEGGTNLEEALRLAGELALRHYAAEAQNRIVLLTDGAANLGNANPAQLGELIAKLRQQGVAFDACGVGAEGYNDDILESLTRKGNGRYYFLNSPESADASFARQLAGALHPAAQDVKMQVRFNPARVGAYRLIGFEKHRLKTEDFRNDKVAAAELAAEEAAVAVYQVEALPEGEGELGDVFVRFRDPADGNIVEQSWTMSYEPQAPSFDKASPSMQLAGAATLLGEKLRHDPIDGLVDLNALAPTLNRLRGFYEPQARVRELVTMFDQMRRMQSSP